MVLECLRDSQSSPSSHQSLSLGYSVSATGDYVQLQSSLQVLNQTLLLEQEWDVVQGRDVMHGQDLRLCYVTEHGHFGSDGRRQGGWATAGNLSSPAQV